MKKSFIISLLALTLFSGMMFSNVHEVNAAKLTPDEKAQIAREVNAAGAAGIIRVPDETLQVLTEINDDETCASALCQKVRTWYAGSLTAGTLPSGYTAGASSIDKCWIDTLGMCEPNNLLGNTLNLLTWLLGYLVYFAGAAFDFVVNISIVQFKVFVDSGFVNAGWGILRNVCNLFFIFILLYTALKTVLGMEGDTKRAVIRVVLCALFINFSLTATKLVIDAGNATALYFYNASTRGGPLSEQIMETTHAIGLSGLVTAGRAAAASGGVSGTTGTAGTSLWTNFDDKGVMEIVVSGFLGLIFIGIVLLLLVASAAMFITRIVYLIWILITSPYPFLTYAYSGDSNPKDWFKTLMDQTFLAPIFFIIFYIALTVAAALPAATTAHFADVGPVTGILLQNIVKVVNFIIVICFFTAALTTAKGMSGKWGQAAAGFAESKLKSYGAKGGEFLAKNTLGRGGRVVARAGQGLADNRITRRLAQGDMFGDSRLGRLANRATGLAGRTALQAGDAAAAANLGFKGESLKEKRKAEVEEREALYKRLGETNKGDIERRARQDAARQQNSAGGKLAEERRIAEALLDAPAEEAKNRDKELKRAAKEQGYVDGDGNGDIDRFKIGNKAAHDRIVENFKKQYSTQEVEKRARAEHRQKVVTDARTRYTGEEKVNAARRQSSLITNMASRTGSLSPGADYEALSKIDTGSKTEAEYGDRIKAIADRIKDIDKKIEERKTEVTKLKGEKDQATSAAPFTKQAELDKAEEKLDDLEDKKITYGGTLENLNNQKKAAEARAAGH